MLCAKCGDPVPSNGGCKLGRRWMFCGGECRIAWANARVLFLEAELNLIRNRCRGRAREIAKNALTGNVSSVGGGE